MLALAACAGGSATVWLKPGVETGVAFREEAACRAEARRLAPVDRRISTAPSITLGVGLNRCSGNVCIGAGTARDVFDADRNEPRRDQAFGACMGRAGYALTSLPRCRGAVTPLATHPFDTRGVCVAADGTLAAP
ncbi:hypothetical protein JQC91_09315 [Jannaschia sp. Os4]|uniref:hypothetical protein n=1 Tax=Jannaschia sp. Os4 TaxID=2807617 RepID=UPI001939F4CC|nr:hypothetical protein [Jannaschia sp. Os4]MBM2576506.1 hypothetical protein [Jannaschia sp. Os4]